MKGFSLRFLTHALAACAIVVLGFAAPANAQEADVGVLPATATGPTHTMVPVTITVINAGPGDATGVTLTFDVPKGLKFALDGGGVCSSTRTKGISTVSCTWAIIPAPVAPAIVSSASVTLSFQSAQAESDGIQTNISADQLDLNPDNQVSSILMFFI